MLRSNYLSQAATNVFRLLLNFTEVYEPKPLKESLTSSSTGSGVYIQKVLEGRIPVNSRRKVGLASGLLN